MAEPVPVRVPSQLAGRAAVPFGEFVLKVHSRCNLSCDYCYVYQMADQSWRSRPLVMSRRTLGRVGHRIAEHVERHRLDRVRVVLHGGEPLLAGPAWFAEAAVELRGLVPAEVDLTVQTNGVLLDEAFLELLAEHRIQVGVSLDGTRAGHDRHRVWANGTGSHAQVSRALRLLGGGPYRDLFAGLLCTVDLANDPVETYRALLEFDPPAIDLLLPLGNWTVPPPGRTPDPARTPYADWLIAVFDHWYGAPRQETRIRFFAEIINLVLGGRSRTESVGAGPVALVVVDTDGAIEQVDTLKSTFHGAAVTGLNVFDHPFDRALEHPAVQVRQLGLAGLCATCQRCPVRAVCGGGYYPHRYRAGTGFDNPSVYCPDLFRLVEHIAHRVRAGLAERARLVPGAAR